MKRVEYTGEDTRTFAHSGVKVSQGDVIEVDDDFDALNFSVTDKPVSIKATVPPIEIPATTNEESVEQDAGATEEKVASTDTELVEHDAERGE